MVEFDPVSTYTKNDLDLYVGIREASKQLEISERSNRASTKQSKKLNVITDKLTMKAMTKSEIYDPEWNCEMGRCL